MTEKTEHGYAMLLLGKLLEAHDIPVNPYGDWFLNGNTLPAIRCMWFRSESQKSGQLDLQVAVKDGVILNESVAGIGPNEDALQDAFYNLNASSLHVFLAAFWNRIDLEHVTVEQIKIDDLIYTAYIGNFGLRASNDNHPGVPEGAVQRILDALKSSDIQNEYHWASCFYCDVGDGKRVHSALLDNVIWREGSAAIKSLPWENIDDYYSVRHFVILKRMDEIHST